LQPTITHFDDGDGETEHVYVGRTLTFDVDHGRSVLARIYDDRPHVATLVNVSYLQVEESSVARIVDWLRAAGVKTVEVMGPDGSYIALADDEG
jgi:dihydrodipicolinate synthase/N-acetylneuraminate lyase